MWDVKLISILFRFTIISKCGYPLLVARQCGCRYHKCPACGYPDDWGMHEQDPRKTARLEAAGFYVVRLWEHEVVHDSERVGVILVLLRGQKWRAFQRVLDELDRAEEAAIERGRPKLLGRLLQRAKQESARQGKPLHPDIVAFYRSEMSEWSLRNPEGDLRRRPRQDARAAFGL